MKITSKKEMKTRIEAMYRFGRKYHVLLACGHSFDCPVEQAEEQHLFISKPYRCRECQGAQ